MLLKANLEMEAIFTRENPNTEKKLINHIRKEEYITYMITTTFLFTKL